MRSRYCKPCGVFHPAGDWPHAKPVSENRAQLPEYDDYLLGPKAGRFLRCKSCGDLHDVSAWPDNHMEEPPQRSELAAPYIISDNLEVIGGLNGVQSMADGRHYTSKAKMRAEQRARGMIEMGNDKPAPFKKPRPDRKAIKEAVHRAANAVMNEGARVENFVKQQKVKPGFGRVAVG